MSDSESPFEREPNTFDGESLDDHGDFDSEAVSLDAESGANTDVEIIDVGTSSVPTHDIGKGLMTSQPMSLAVVYSDRSHAKAHQYCEFQVVETRMPDRHPSHQLETLTFGCVEATAAPPSQPKVTIVHQGNPRVPVGVPKKYLFGVDDLEPNKITEWELTKIRKEFRIPDSVRMRIPGPTESLSNPKDGEVAVFTHILQLGVWLPLHPPVQRILSQIGYALRQYNPNFWVALIGVILAFGLAEEGEPSYEQFSYLYSITKSKCADHGGWVKPTVSGLPNMVTLSVLYRHLRSPGGIGGCFSLIEKVRLKVPAVERVYPGFLFTENLIKTHLVDPAEMTDARKSVESKKMFEGSKRLFQAAMKGKKQCRQSEVVPERAVEADALEEQTLADRQRQLNAKLVSRRAPDDELAPRRGPGVEVASSKASKKWPMMVDLDAASTTKHARHPILPMAVFAAEEEEGPTEAITIACPLKTVQFLNHMILGSQMELSEIEELPKRLLREEARRAFHLQATRAITVAERDKRMYDDGRAKVVEAGKAL
ncbi:unnamed protein product [Prunus armeniaca]